MRRKYFAFINRIKVVHTFKTGVFLAKWPGKGLAASPGEGPYYRVAPSAKTRESNATSLRCKAAQSFMRVEGERLKGERGPEKADSPRWQEIENRPERPGQGQLAQATG